MATRRKNWRTIWPTNRTPWVPYGPHVYAIYVDGRLIYVGSSADLPNRMCQYAFKATGDGQWSCRVRNRRIVAAEIYLMVKKSRKYGQWLMDEARLIRRLRPEMNRVGVKGGATCPT